MFVCRVMIKQNAVIADSAWAFLNASVPTYHEADNPVIGMSFGQWCRGIPERAVNAVRTLCMRQDKNVIGKPLLWTPFIQRPLHKRKGGQVRFSNDQTIELEKKFETQKAWSGCEELFIIDQSLECILRSATSWAMSNSVPTEKPAFLIRLWTLVCAQCITACQLKASPLEFSPFMPSATPAAPPSAPMQEQTNRKAPVLRDTQAVLDSSEDISDTTTDNPL
ncbi:unnamed protein product [Leuciscus chuanchicus]